MIFGIGTDIIEIPRVAKQLAGTDGLRERLFSMREIAYCESRGISSQHYAARFAAKEAFLKAIGTGLRNGFRFSDIEIVNDDLGSPGIVLHGDVKTFCFERSITGMHVSLSHTKDLAEAVVVLETTQP